MKGLSGSKFLNGPGIPPNFIMNIEKKTHTPTANDVQIGGDHYKSHPIQPWDFIVANDLGFLEGNVVKYVCRFRKKNGLADLEKAKHYLDKLIEVEKAGAWQKLKGQLSSIAKTTDKKSS